MIMKIDEKETLKQRINEKIETLKKDIISFKQLTKPIAPDNAIGRLTRMEAISSKSINDAALNKSKATLLKLEHALVMIDDPDFGLCKECEEPIPFKRLMVMPEASHCVQCAEKMQG